MVRPGGEGDSRFAVFARASDAVAGALAIQRASHTERWPGELALRVGMAMHTGEADLRAGDYYGAAVNRCARLRALAHGGQVLISQAICDLARVSLPPDTLLRDLGWHRLQDLAEPEHVYQLTHPDLPTEFPLLRSMEAPLHNLPVQVSSFVGRDGMIAQIRPLLDTHSLLTLTGPGGIGKTRLALRIARHVLNDYADGVYFVTLGALTEPDQVVPAIARALGVRDHGVGSIGDQVAKVVQNKHVLLLLDNFRACAAGGRFCRRAHAHLPPSQNHRYEPRRAPY